MSRFNEIFHMWKLVSIFKDEKNVCVMMRGKIKDILKA